MPRGRPSRIDRPSRLEVQLPESLHSRVKLELFSDVEGRIPSGETSKLVTRLLTEWLRDERGVQI